MQSRWQRARVGECLRLKYGKTLHAKFRDPSARYPVVGSAGRMTATAAPLAPVPVVVIGRKGNVGAVSLELAGCWPIDTTYFAEIPPELEPRFLAFQLQALNLKRLDSSTTTPSLRRQDLEAQWLSIPSGGEQHRIVELLENHLSRLDAASLGLANARRRLISLERSALDVYFGADASVPLDQFIDDISTGKSFGSSSAPAKDGEWGIIKVSAMTWGEFKPDENKAVPADRIDPRFEIREGDLLVSRANTADYVGASVLVGPARPKLLLSDKSLRLTANESVRPDWLWRALQAPSARRQISALATGTKDSMRNISQGSLRRILLPKVSIADQARALAAYADVKESSDQLRSEVEVQQARLVGLHRAILAAAFSGQLTGRSRDLDQVGEMAGA